MIQKIVDGKHQTAMGSFHDLMDMLNGKTKANTHEISLHVENAKSGYDSWYNDPDNGQCSQRLKGDFKYAADLMRKMKGNFQGGNIVSLQPEFQFGLLDGTEVEMDAYMRHDPRCLGRINMPEMENGERVIRVAVGIGGNCGISAEELVNRAARVLKVVDEYSEAGYGVEVFALYAGTRSYENIGSGLFNAIVDCSKASTGQIISGLASAKIFRTLVFAMLCHLDNPPSGLGYPVNETQSKHLKVHVETHVKKILGAHTKIIHAGANDEQIRKAIG